MNWWAVIGVAAGAYVLGTACGVLLIDYAQRRAGRPE